MQTRESNESDAGRAKLARVCAACLRDMIAQHASALALTVADATIEAILRYWDMDTPQTQDQPTEGDAE